MILFIYGSMKLYIILYKENNIFYQKKKRKRKYDLVRF